MPLNRPYRLYCKRKGPSGGANGGGNYCVAVRDGKLCLARPKYCDHSQFWQKEEGDKGTFMLVHQATNKAVKYRNPGDQLQLVNKPPSPDKSVSWSESGDITSGYVFVRTSANLNMVMDAWTGQIADGIGVSIYPNQNSDNELWKLVRC